MSVLNLRLLIGLAAVSILTLVGCAAVTQPSQEPTASDSSATSESPSSVAPSQPSEEASPNPVATLFSLTQSVDEQLEVLQNIIQLSQAEISESDVTRLLTKLVDAGFPRESITHTRVKTPSGLTPESVSIAVQLGDYCLIGQYAPDWVSVSSMPPLTSGCLIGNTVTPFPQG